MLRLVESGIIVLLICVAIHIFAAPPVGDVPVSDANLTNSYGKIVADATIGRQPTSNAGLSPLYTVSGGGKAKATVPARVKAQINVMAPPYNAKGDAVTDDTAAIQAAYTAAGAISGASVLFPKGIFLVTSRGASNPMISVPSGVATLGMGQKTTTIRVKRRTGDYSAIFQVVDSSDSFSNLTIDQNNQGNPITSMNPRFAIASFAGVKVQKVEVKNIGAVNTVVTGGGVVTIAHNLFEIDGSGTYYHDHSTIYVHGTSGTICDNVFQGVINGAGSGAAIETHMGHVTVTGNVIDSYMGGMNITGIDMTDSDDVIVSNNRISHADGGISLWSMTYRKHTSGYGLRNVTISDNVIRITQTAWTINGISGLTPVGPFSGIASVTTANLPMRDISIQHNRVEYDLESSRSAPYSLYSTGIGYWDINYAGGSFNTVQNFHVSDNGIINAPTSGISMVVAGSGITISGNTILNPGSAANPGLKATYRNGISLDGKQASDVLVEHNMIKDMQATSTMVRCIQVFGDARANYSVAMLDNTFALADATHLSLASLISTGLVISPSITGQVLFPTLTTRLLPSHAANGSHLKDLSSGAIEMRIGGVWKLSPPAAGTR